MPLSGRSAVLFEERRNEFCRIAFRKKLDASIKALLADLDEGIRTFNKHAVAAMVCRVDLSGKTAVRPADRLPAGVCVFLATQMQ
jgi:hypothetical protein